MRINLDDEYSCISVSRDHQKTVFKQLSNFFLNCWHASTLSVEKVCYNSIQIYIDYMSVLVKFPICPFNVVFLDVSLHFKLSLSTDPIPYL